MTQQQIFDKVRELMSNQLGIDPSEIKLDSRMNEDLKADSANVIMLVMDLENEFNITVNDEALTDIKTVSDVVRGIDAMVNG